MPSLYTAYKKSEFSNQIKGEVLLYFPNTLDCGLAQYSNRCRSYPIDILLDICIWLHSDVNVLSKKKKKKKKKDFGGKKELKFNYLPPLLWF